MSRFVCVFIKTAPKWRAARHVHWFVCKKCLKRIASGEKDWRPIPDNHK